MQAPVPAIVLSAGASSRMGSPKALLDVGGRPALECVVAALRDGGADPIIVVVGRHRDEIRDGADLSGTVVVDHRGWEAGRTSSIQAGLAHVPKNAPGTVLALVDMPLVAPATVQALLAGFGPGIDFCVPAHAGQRGHPILLGRALFPDILALGPDEPLRDLLRTRRRRLVPVDDPGILLDFDTPGDAAGLSTKDRDG